MNVLAFEPDGRPIAFPTWLDDLQLFLLTDAKDGVSLFDYATGTAAAPADSAPAVDRSQWLTRDAAARLAIRNHLPIAERAHFSQHKTAKALYDAVVARYSSPATAAVGGLILPYLSPDLSSFPTAADLITHLRDSEARFNATLKDEFRAKNPPSLYFTLYLLVTRLPDTLSTVRDHFLAIDAPEITLDDFERQLHAAEKNLLAVGAARGTPRTPLFEGCSPSPLAPSYASVATPVDLPGAEKVATASAPSGKRGGGRGGKGGRGGGGGGGGSDGGGGGGGGGVEVVVGVVEVAAAARGEEAVVVGVVVEAGVGPASSSSRGSSSSSSARPPPLSSFMTGMLGVGRLGVLVAAPIDAWRAKFPDATEFPNWADLLRRDVNVYDLDYDAILAAMYALTVSAEGDCYLCVPPGPGIETAALGARASDPSGTASAQALHTFTLDSGASRCFFRDSTAVTPLPAPVPVSLADPSGGPVLARATTVLPCPAVPSACGDLYLLQDWPPPGHVHP
ncbi:unnamed protein product [Closterium sp. Yama58-4]|nr:unnamed protein product [Closterium sp. Yama58-4]